LNHPRYWDEFQSDFDLSGIATRRLIASDGYPLHVFDLNRGHTDCIVVISPLSTSSLLLLPLMRLLSHTHRVMFWEIRGSPFLEDSTGPYATGSVGRHAEDLIEIVSTLQIDPFNVLAWCSGCAVTSWAARRIAAALRRIVMISPVGICQGQVETPFQRFAMPLLSRLIDPACPDAFAICRTFQDTARAGHARIGSSDLLQRASCINLRSAESIVRYAGLMRDFESATGGITGHIEGTLGLYQELQRTSPTLLLHCVDDSVVDYHCSLQLAQMGACSKFVLYNSGGHFMPFLNPVTIHADAIAFLNHAD
jgi:pimeloyl-ACP methyl ester carboxylesterase